jgi:hypothetical protein
MEDSEFSDEQTSAATPKRNWWPFVLASVLVLIVLGFALKIYLDQRAEDKQKELAQTKQKVTLMLLKEELVQLELESLELDRPPDGKKVFEKRRELGRIKADLMDVDPALLEDVKRELLKEKLRRGF